MYINPEFDLKLAPTTPPTPTIEIAMVSSTNDVVFQRRNKQIEDAIDAQNLKQALQLIEKRIKKGEGTRFLNVGSIVLLVLAAGCNLCGRIIYYIPLLIEMAQLIGMESAYPLPPYRRISPPTWCRGDPRVMQGRTTRDGP